MTATGLVDGQEEYLVLASDLDSWDGSVEGADALRARLLALPPQRVKPEGDVQRVTHLRRLADKLGFGGGKKGKPNGSVDPSTVVFTERWSTISDDRVLAWSGILMGAPERAGWPFDVHALPDDPPRKAKSKPDSVRSVAELLLHAPPRPEIIAFIACAFTARQRDVWLPVSRTAAALASRSNEVLDELSRAWEAVGPPGKKVEPLPNSDPAARWCGYTEDQQRHAKRHFLYLRAALAARGCPLAGATPESLLGSYVNLKDECDKSVGIHGMAEIVRSKNVAGAAWRPSIEALLNNGFKQDAGYQLHEGLRDLAAALDAAPDLQLRVAQLALTPPSLKTSLPRGIETAVAAVESAQNFAGLACYSGEHGRKQLMMDVSNALDLWKSPLLKEIGVDQSCGVEDPSGALVDRLACCSGPMLRTMPIHRGVGCLAELILLTENPHNVDLRWSDLVFRAGLQPLPGIADEALVADVAGADLAIRLVEMGYGEIPRLLHRHRPTRASAVALLRQALGGGSVGSGHRARGKTNGFLIDQSAVAAAGMLYSPASGGGLEIREKVRLLWELLEVDPPVGYWRAIQGVLRGRDTLSHRLVTAIEALDASRPVPDRFNDHGERARAFTEWRQYNEGRVSLQQAGSKLAELGVSALKDAMSRTPEGDWPSLPTEPRGPTWDALKTWRTRLAALMEPEESNRGSVVTWVTWLRSPDGTEPCLTSLGQEVEEAHSDLQRALLLVEDRAKGDRLHASDLERAEVSVEAMASALRSLKIAWPPRCLIDVPLAQLADWCTALAKRLRKNEEVEADLLQAIFVGDEPKVLAVFENSDGRVPDTSLFSFHALKAAHEFLLAQLLYRDATRIRRLILADRPESRLSSVLVHFAPLWSGVLGGGFFTLSLAKTWNDIAKLGGPTYYTALVGAVVGALAFLMYDLRSRIVSASDKSVGVWTKVAKRVAPAFGAAAAIAAGETSLLLWVCQGTETVMNGTGQAFRVDVATAAGLRAAALWSAISLFGGIFVGLVAQGRGAVAERQEPTN